MTATGSLKAGLAEGRYRWVVNPAQEAIHDVMRQEHARVLAFLIGHFGGDFQLAEDAWMEAVASALEVWPHKGVPHRPAAWLTTVARRRGIDQLRRERTRRDQAPAMVEEPPEPTELFEIPDEQLRLFFTCCHPALKPEAQVALTLHTLGGLSTPEIASAFLVSETTMAQRLVRAKKKIKQAKIPFRIPPIEVLPERLKSLLQTLYLIFNEGYAAHSGDDLVRKDLCENAIHLGRVLAQLMPGEPEVRGLLALMLLHHSRREARVNQHTLVPLHHQDRALWDQPCIEEGCTLVTEALREGLPGPYQIQAAIAALHAQAQSDEQTDWPQIALLYQQLYRHVPSPVVALNHQVAVGMAGHPKEALAGIKALDSELSNYQPYHAALAEMSRLTGDFALAKASYRRARDLSHTEAERRFFQDALVSLGEG